MPKRIYQNFFELQRRYKKNSMILYALFIMAMMIHVLLALLFFMAIWWMIFGDLTEFAWFWVVILIPSYFVLNVLYHYNKIAHDDVFLLKDIEVTRLFINTSGMEVDKTHFSSDDKKNKHQVVYANNIKDFEPIYRRYYEFAEQLAIASNITLPKLYVMNEKGVNAFVAGLNHGHMMLVVTKGALELDNESLYGLIGHEYGHILHGDAKLNVQMYVLMSGLSWLYDLADGLEWLSKWRQQPKAKRYYYQNEKAERQEYVVVTDSGRLSVEFLSLIIRLFGFLGMASSEWIKQHFNRQREFLADATSVQLTRSDGVVQLLQTLERSPYLARTQKRYTTHLSYFFFLNPHDAHGSLNWRDKMEQMGRTHPSHQERVAALKTHEYDEFAKMATDDLDKDFLQTVHDKMMSVSVHKAMTNDYKTIEFTLSENECVLDDGSSVNKDVSSTFIPVYEHKIEVSHDKVIDGRLVVDDTWKSQNMTEEVVYPKKAKADHELKNVYHVNITHVKNMTLPLMITRYLRNDDVKRDMSKLFLLFYTIILCHDSDEILVYQEVCLNGVFNVLGKNDLFVIDKELLKTVANMDRRIDNGLLLIIYQRLSQDLRNDSKQQLLKNDYLKLVDFINENNKNDNKNRLGILWQGVHLYRLLSVFDNHDDIIDSPLYKKLNFIHQKYDIHISEWIVIIFTIYMVISHDNDIHQKEKHITTIHRLIRLINHQIVIDKEDVNKLIDLVKSFSSIDISRLLLKYQDKNSLTAKRYIDTLHTALLSDGMLCECDYEILLTLHQYWCPNDELIFY